MALVIAGIDEAGYGPLLGPLCVGMAVLRVEAWQEGDPAPDLWKLLSPQVCREAGRGKGAGGVPIADSKKLKLANDVARGHPVMHLERGVLTFLRCLGGPSPENDEQLRVALGAAFDGHVCYAGEPLAMPLAWTREQIGIAANLVGAALERAGVTVLDVRCQALSEPAFNQIVTRTNSKAEANLAAISVHVRRVWERWVGSGDSVRLVCDRLGGRTAYAGVLKRMIGAVEKGVEVRVVEETDLRSRYLIEAGEKRLGVAFQTEGEDAHLPVALASMTAKLVREIAMIRFNRYWGKVWVERRGGGGDVELKPTVGYTLDARRWLRDADRVLTPKDRELLVRRA